MEPGNAAVPSIETAVEHPSPLNTVSAVQDRSYLLAQKIVARKELSQGFSALLKAVEEYASSQEHPSATNFTTKQYTRHCYSQGLSYLVSQEVRDELYRLGLIEAVSQKRNWSITDTFQSVAAILIPQLRYEPVNDRVQRLEMVIPLETDFDAALKSLGADYIYGSWCAPFSVQSLGEAFPRTRKRPDAITYGLVEMDFLEQWKGSKLNTIGATLRLSEAAIGVWQKRHAVAPILEAAPAAQFEPNLGLLISRHQLYVPLLAEPLLNHAPENIARPAVPTVRIKSRTEVPDTIRREVGDLLAAFYKGEDRELRHTILRVLLDFGERTFQPADIVNHKEINGTRARLTFSAVASATEALTDRGILARDAHIALGWRVVTSWHQKLSMVLSAKERL